ncbi:hypothetical protein COT99_02155 [Candidatus Falkowbacteria bacterium CG10_big_fil_rev_8_21_14_0_10_43_10]|uniref:3D domain-containing protein n=1 Tax=Candidatus Falkowbacteria bacterium CG10_big_fil_rev_8_21_14_0_10_43_10 TaxID=1974567 RepID=A0A2H0V256_9BACT|nr:MAG: hypothetical protein COT99_02155 [Candidatus Falkowbacteria bacterium CG10_big_fil_rev_8_21_14_0_10_43_10]
MKSFYFIDKKPNFLASSYRFLPKSIKTSSLFLNKGKGFNILENAFVFGKRLKISKNIIGFLILAILFQFVLFTAPALADQAVEESKVIAENGAVLTEREVELIEESLIIKEHLPDVEELEFSGRGVRTITAYNSEVAQCDDDPCTTANGFNVCKHGVEDTIAANFLKFGTKVRIPKLFGDRIFVVRDRMNKRYPDRIDVWMIDKTEAKQFGVKRAEIQIINI